MTESVQLWAVIKTPLTRHSGVEDTTSILQRRLTHHLFKAGDEVGHLAKPDGQGNGVNRLIAIP
jgi:hypothetical protein